MPNELLIQHLRTGDQYRLFAVKGIRHEARLEDYVVRGLLAFEDVSYDLHRELLYQLAGQVVNHLRGYLSNDDEVRNVLIYYEGQITSLVHSQMVDHYWEDQAAFESSVSKGFTALRTPSYTKQDGLQPLDFRQNTPQGVNIRSVVFGGFSRCLYPVQKFDVMPELRLARVLEADANGVKAWFRPPIRQIFIWLKSGELYVPDFVVETETEKLLVEVKNEDELDDSVVQQKADAAIRWCVAASAHEEANGGKRWRYLLIPHDQITASSSLEGLKQSYALC